MQDQKGRTGTTDHVTTVATIYEAFGRGDVPAILDHLDDAVAWDTARADHYGVPWLRPRRDKQGVGEFFASLQDLDFLRFDVKSIVGAGDTVIALIDAGIVVKRTGKGIDDLEAHVWTFGPDGRVHAFQHIVDTMLHVRAIAD
jgi:ketosteroid isomerase-like protein